LNLINLRSLKLIDLNLTKLGNRTFIHFRKLEHLSIIKSHIKQIEPETFFSCHNLRYLNLDQNDLNDSSWFSLIKYLTNLEILILSQNKFHSILFNIKSLKHLDISSNGLEELQFDHENSLEKVYLQNNQLNSLQLKFVFLLKNLRELNLDFNRLTFLPEKIFQLNSNLIYLSLQGNDLNYLTNQTFFGLKNLIQLNLARNNLQSIDQPFEDLNSLKILNLDRNFQINLSKNIFQGLAKSLIELSLQNCNLTMLNNSFSLFTNLQRIKLSSNYLKELPEEFLSNSLHSLISIDLQRNLFSSFPNLNGNASKLIDFDLSSNRLTSLEQNDLLKYPKLKTIGLTGNPLRCDCHLKWIKQWLMDNYDHDLIKFLQWTCAAPVNLLGKQLTAIKEQEMICDDNGETTTTR
jgi:Leucine-rich repeat (LRR) protein